jgi:hypothetical protein
MIIESALLYYHIFICPAPVISRPITLYPLAFHVLIAGLHAAAGGLLTLATTTSRLS